VIPKRSAIVSSAGQAVPLTLFTRGVAVVAAICTFQCSST
jgi:hypothetical protein